MGATAIAPATVVKQIQQGTVAVGLNLKKWS